MPPRLNKRQQREQEELAALNVLQSNTPQPLVNEESESEEEVSLPKGRPSGFAALQTAASAEPEDSEDDTPQKPKKKSRKKKKGGAESGPSTNSPTPNPSSHQNPKQQLKGPKGKGKAAPEKQEEDLDAILKKMSLKYSHVRNPDAPPSKKRELWELLSVQPTFLDGDEELRRFFGSKIMDSAKPKQKRGHAPLRSLLTKPTDEWRLSGQPQGVTMRQLTDSERSGKSHAISDEKWWTFEHDIQYKKVTIEFLNAVAVGDPNVLGGVLHANGWHVDTLLQLGEVFRQQDDLQHAGDLVQRAIYASEKAFAGPFNLSAGMHRLDFDRIENRPFFLAMHRDIMSLERRGCNRAAFEAARLLLSLDPFRDPHGALLHLDYLAPRSGQNAFILKLWDVCDDVNQEEPVSSGQGSRVSPKYLPGMAYARALAIWNQENETTEKNHAESTKALEEAILAFPSIVPLIADKANMTLSGEVRALPSMRIETAWDSFQPAISAIHLLSHLYAHRSLSIWKQPTHVEWLQKTTNNLLPRLKATQSHPLREASLKYFAKGPTLAVCRHAMLTEIRSLISFFPPSTLADSMHAYDPLPPKPSETSYDDIYFKDIPPSYIRDQIKQRRQAAEQRIQQLLRGQFAGADGVDLADPEVQQMLLAQLRGQADVEDQFGEDAGAAIAGVDAAEAFAEPAVFAGAAAAGIPGAFNQDTFEEPEELPDLPQPGAQGGQGQGFLQTLWNGLFGRRSTNEEEGSHDEQT